MEKTYTVYKHTTPSNCEEQGIPVLTPDEVAKLKYIEMREK